MNPHSPDVSVVICTRNRGASVTRTLKTVLANDHPSFEVILVDQSTDGVTASAIRPFCADARLRYLPLTSKGLGRARNAGIAQARGAVVAFTDDDCTVPAHWLRTMAAIFERHPQVAVAFSNVTPALYDSEAGFIPHYLRGHDQLVRTMWQKCGARGIGASVAVRRSAVLELGGFDEALGAGAEFPSCDDGDMAVRVLLRGWHVYESAAVAVVHDGFRTWQQGQELTKRDWVGIGAAYAKPLKCGHYRVLIVAGYEGIVRIASELLGQALRGRRPRGFKQALYFWRGFAAGLRAPVDCRHIKFALKTEAA